MERIERETALDSLNDLESYYQSRYEYYLALATEASSNRERVRLLLLDLAKNVPYPEYQSLVENKQVELGLPKVEQPQLSDLPEDENEEKKEPEYSSVDSSSNSQSEQLKEVLRGLSQAMSAIEFACRLEQGKSLHKSYLHSILKRELSQELSDEIVDLYLDEAVNRGLIERDEFDNQCYITVSNKEISNKNLAQSNGHSRELEKQPIAQPRQRRTKQIQTKHRNLPPSSKLKLTLLETMKQYMTECNPKRFSAENVINYLYSTEQQAKWPRSNAHKVRVSISNVLSRKEYLGKYWKRVEPGIYKPLSH